jgi:RNA polymerase sigma-70 factor, ECF subfamily
MSSRGDLVELARRAKRHDPLAFGELFDMYFEKLRRYIGYQIGDLDAAEELASEVFTRALAGIDNFDDRGGTLGAWLYGIARNLAARHRESHARLVTVDIEQVLIISNASSPEGTVLRNETYADLYRAICSLSPVYRDVIYFRFIEGNDVKTVAELTGRKPAAVRLLQHRAILALRQRMAASDQVEGGDVRQWPEARG